MESSTEILLKAFVQNALAEDVGDGDHTSLATIPIGQEGESRLLAKEDGILAGLEVAKYIFHEVDPELKLAIFKNDGDRIKKGDEVLHARGSVHSLLKAERLVLNVMQRMSGIATKVDRIVDKLKGTRTKVLDTRKTTPGMRFLEKEAVRIGGGTNHRTGLYDMILIKDNHVDYAGGIAAALKAANDYLAKVGKNLKIEIEVRNLEELQEVLDYGHVDRIMLDNFDISTLKEALKRIGGRFETEASGGITEDEISDYAATGMDYISVGALTHSVKSLDLSLKAIV
ncbi:carboxylating nicotinate-nucleotide diphosphorylase [Olivibacter sitiensis]|uniref:carboxylating nicotinate-nucleotide diphosphorylase n=1 Tax=Olivibacter sitiensis TaxID=376470 RepID=UPI00041E4271|nr:carboxylating nicotinate-nucleotide diphosphorylase [Olivibacter sitiensis]